MLCFLYKRNVKGSKRKRRKIIGGSIRLIGAAAAAAAVAAAAIAASSPSSFACMQYLCCFFINKLLLINDLLGLSTYSSYNMHIYVCIYIICVYMPYTRRSQALLSKKK